VVSRLPVSIALSPHDKALTDVGAKIPASIPVDRATDPIVGNPLKYCRSFDKKRRILRVREFWDAKIKIFVHHLIASVGWQSQEHSSQPE
jgi:hypothetical protein